MYSSLLMFFQSWISSVLRVLCFLTLVMKDLFTPVLQIYSDIAEILMQKTSQYIQTSRRNTGGQCVETGFWDWDIFAFVVTLLFCFSSHAVTSDVTIEETAKAAEMFQSDARESI